MQNLQNDVSPLITCQTALWNITCFEGIPRLSIGKQDMVLQWGRLEDWLTSVRSAEIASYIVNSSHGAVTLLDNRLEGNADMEELSRACKISCWCIQDDEKERPTMGQVVRFLEGVSELGTPPIPRFLRRLLKMAPPFKRRLTVCNSNLYMSKSPSLNQISS